jgi:hypothetical protein
MQITWNNHYGHSIKSTHFLSLDPFEPFSEYGNWNYVFSHVQTPDSKMQTQSHTIEISYFIQLKKKDFTSHYTTDVGGEIDALRPKKTSD